MSKKTFILLLTIFLSGFLVNADAGPTQAEILKNEIREKESLAKELRTEIEQMDRIYTSRGVFYRPANLVKWAAITGTMFNGLFGVAVHAQIPRKLMGAPKNELITLQAKRISNQAYKIATVLALVGAIAYYIDLPQPVESTSISEEEREALKKQVEQIEEDIRRLRLDLKTLS